MERRNTIQRNLVLAAVNRLQCHASADEVYEEVLKEHPTISRATVYRNLNLFKQEGQLISVGVVNGLERFDACTVPHAHFICTHCGAVIDAAGIDPPEHLISRVTCGAVRECVLTFTGICNQCIQPDADNN